MGNSEGIVRIESLSQSCVYLRIVFVAFQTSARFISLTVRLISLETGLLGMATTSKSESDAKAENLESALASIGSIFGE